jgi:hypothetical protein
MLTPLVLTAIVAVIVFALLFVVVAMWMLAHLP